MAKNKNTNTKTTPNSFKDKAFSSLSSLIRLLPTGTVFMFQFLSPLLTNNGHCLTINKYLTGALLVVCSLNCAIATFTDSYTDEEGRTRYGFATFKGLWPSPTPSTTYKVRGGDFVHAALSLVVFGVVAALDPNTVGCYAPGWESTRRTMLMVVPPVVGALCSAVFAVFPSTRHGIGYAPDYAS